MEMSAMIFTICHILPSKIELMIFYYLFNFYKVLQHLGCPGMVQVQQLVAVPFEIIHEANAPVFSLDDHSMNNNQNITYTNYLLRTKLFSV